MQGKLWCEITTHIFCVPLFTLIERQIHCIKVSQFISQKFFANQYTHCTFSVAEILKCGCIIKTLGYFITQKQIVWKTTLYSNISAMLNSDLKLKG